ncbi:hypothetical protein [Microvirga sp. G4-2]|uniref:hypothetical protein n=1 Tax=Microvirga sp. G4-2 TaxID=3434467 RepID=UPI004044C3A2
MEYDIHVTRGKLWFMLTPEEEISLGEWQQYVAGDPEMRLDGFAEAPLPSGGTLKIEDPSIAVWTAYSKNGTEGNQAWIRWWGGNVSVKNPDDEILGKMLQIARSLNARVQGDDGEFYEEK